MSHYTEQVMSITDESLLQKTLSKLGFEVDKNLKTISSNYGHGDAQVDFAFGKNGKMLVGFKKE